MFKSRFIYTPKARKFDLKPIYHDPEKEEQEKRIKALKRKHGLLDDDKNQGYHTLEKGAFKKEMKTPALRMRSKKLLIVLIITLSALAYFILWLNELI